MQKTISHYAITLSELTENAGIDVEKLIDDIELPKETLNSPREWIDNSFATKMVKALWRETNDELFGLSPEPMKMGSWAIACNYMLMAETLGELYRLGAHILSYLPPQSMFITLPSER